MKDFNSDGVITISDYKELFLAIPNGLLGYISFALFGINALIITPDYL